MLTAIYFSRNPFVVGNRQSTSVAGSQELGGVKMLGSFIPAVMLKYPATIIT